MSATISRSKGSLTKPTSRPQHFPGPTGNLKVENNAFVLGNLYIAVNDPSQPLTAANAPNVQWFDLPSYIASQIPEVQIHPVTINVPADLGAPKKFSFAAKLKTDIVSPDLRGDFRRGMAQLR